MYEEIDPDGDFCDLDRKDKEEAFTQFLDSLLVRAGSLNDGNDPRGLIPETRSDSPKEEELSTGEVQDHSSPPAAEQSSFKVSSKHLSLASRRFKAMLAGDWSEAHTIHDDGLRHVEVEGFNPEAYKIIMNAIHGNYRGVPRQIHDLELLSQLALIVDDLDCLEAVEILCDLWLQGWWEQEDVVNRRLILMIFISSVFRHGIIFERATYIAIMASEEPIPSLGLPIHDHILNKINETREYAVNEAVKVPRWAIDLLCNTVGLCSSRACRAMMIGTLVTEAHVLSLFDPLPEMPFHGRSYNRTVKDIRQIQVPEWYENKRGRCMQHSGDCTLQILIGPKLDELDRTIKGLNIDAMFSQK
ncbi:hypothetical protein BR93DRAFT_979644 [Coniochaeta sp. PMI_546]|nr:hypothetical protein BR93DRAFT_979644 [Coniochaeta sp. PMI_546]